MNWKLGLQLSSKNRGTDLAGVELVTSTFIAGDVTTNSLRTTYYYLLN